MEIHTLKERIAHCGKALRIGFTHYVVEKYGLNINTAYGKIRRREFRKWEVEGILNCISDFSPEYLGKPEDFFSSLPTRQRFLDFMRECGMSDKVARRRFVDFDFTELELRGFGAAYREYMLRIKEGGKDET